MHEELVTALRKRAVELPEKFSKNAENIDLFLKAADAIDKLVKICNSILSKYEEEAEAVIWEYSWNIDEDIDELRKEIEDYKAQINGVAEPPKEEEKCI